MSVAKLKAAYEATNETYVQTTAGVLAAAVKELGPFAYTPGSIGAWALKVVEVDPEKRMGLHRDNHVKWLLDRAPKPEPEPVRAHEPPAVTDGEPKPGS